MQIIYLFLILLISSRNTFGLKCYQCDSSKDEYCPETWDRTDIEPTECDHIDYPSFCVKTTGIYGAIVGTRRFCSSRHLDNSCNEVYFPQDPRIYYSCLYTCTTDGCNHSTSLYYNLNSKSIIYILLSFVVSKFWFNFLI